MPNITPQEVKENLYEVDCIRTFTGIYMNVFEPTLEMICIEDIAHALSMQCRFGGHLPRFYSVAQHSFYCADSVSFKYYLQALMHDASEAYLMDIPRPIKGRLTNYKEIENKLMLLIAEKFGFEYPLSETVKWADERMLEWEWRHIMLSENITEPDCWHPREAEIKFLQAYSQFAPITSK